MADDPSGLEPPAIFSIVPAETWTMVRSVQIGGLLHYSVKRNGLQIGVIAQQWGGLERNTNWFWSIHRLHQLGHFQGRGESLDECKKQFRETWDRVVAINGIKRIEGALLPVHARPVTRPFRPVFPYAKPRPVR
jgi:hypothetical protein